MPKEHSCPTREYGSLNGRSVSAVRSFTPETDLLDQLVGITGVGWTVSISIYLVSTVGYGTTVIPWLVSDPQSLLYLGGALFVATFWLDRLRRTRSSDDG